MANKVKQMGAIRAILPSAPSGLSGVLYYDSGLSKLRFFNGSVFAELADFVQLQDTGVGTAGSNLVNGENKAYTNIAGLTTFTLQDFLDQIDVALGTSGGSSFSDALFNIYDDGDVTKLLKFQASGIATGTTRTITMPNADVDLGNLTNSNIAAGAAIAYSKLALTNSIVNADINASAAIAYSKLNLSASIVNADVAAGAAIAYSKLALTNSIVNADINASAAIAYSKLNLAGSIVNADIATAAAIARSKLASGTSNRIIVNDGAGVLSDAAAITAGRALISDANGIPTHSTVTATELGYSSGVTSSIQTQINSKISLSEKGANNGVATLDAGGKIPVGQLPSSVMEYKGTWAASTNTPTLADGTGDPGDVYIASDAGTVDFGSGPIDFVAGDWVVYNGSIWQKSSSSNSVISVNGQTGVVVLDTDDISEGANLYFTDERAQDAVGGIVANSSKVSLTYNDGTPSIVADIVAGSLVNADINAAAGIVYSKLSLTNGIVNADINSAAAIAYSKLALTNSIVNADINSAAAISYSKLNLSASIVNADIAAGAAIAYSKLNLTGSIVNADINATAAIALSKLAALTTGRALQSNASTGFIEVSAVTNTELGYVSGVTSSIQTQLNGKLSSVSQDTAPALGGDLDPAGFAIKNTVRFGNSAANSVEEDYLHAQSLTASTTAVLASLTFDSKVYKSLLIEYTARRGNDRRTGTIMVSANNVNGVASSVVQCFHDELDTTDLALTWDVGLNGDNVEVSYTTSTGTYVANLHVKRFKA